MKLSGPVRPFFPDKDSANGKPHCLQEPSQPPLLYQSFLLPGWADFHVAHQVGEVPELQLSSDLQETHLC